jgi:CheY-like chemotaxis protein
MTQDNSNQIQNRVLIVDDDPVSREMVRFALSNNFIVEEANSGEDCLKAVLANLPQMVILDISMPGMNGYETCRKLRESSDLPIIFVSSRDTLKERIDGFESGGNDFIVKPFDAEILTVKVKLSIETHIEHKRLANEKKQLQKTALEFLSNMSDSGVLMQFVRSNISCCDHFKLAVNLLEATEQYGIHCHVQIRHPNGTITMTPQGQATPLEESVLEKSKEMGRIFQFKRRLVINYNMVSIMVIDTPEAADAAGRIRDNLCILAETAEAIVETITARKSSTEKAEMLQSASINATLSLEDIREQHRAHQRDSRLLLQKLVDEVEKSYIFLGLTDKQEEMVSKIMKDNVEPILSLFERIVGVEEKFNDIINSLTNKKSGDAPEIWLF